MSALLLARIQFAFTIGFHFLFPAMTLGTALVILISETGYLIKKDERYKKITDFFARLLGLIFVVGAATGLTATGRPAATCGTSVSLRKSVTCCRMSRSNALRISPANSP